MPEKYIAITNKLEIELKQMRANGITKLPSETELAAKYACSRQTIRASLNILMNKGLIEKRKGSGSYLTEESTQNRVVFFVAEDCDRYLNPELIAGLRSELRSKFELKTFSTYDNYKEEGEIIRKAIEEKASALVIDPSRDLIPGINDRLIMSAVNNRIPVIYINSNASPEGVLTVAPDYEDMAKKALGILNSQNKKRTACVFRMDSSSGMRGYKGFIDEFADEKLFDDRKCLLLTYKDEKEIMDGNTAVLSSFAEDIIRDTECIICGNGIVAYQLVNVLGKKGISVPEDISVLCFDNGYFRNKGNAQIISVGYDETILCKKLAKTITALSSGTDIGSTVLPFQLF